MSDVAKKVETLMEAMPYLEKYQGKVIVIKYGGNAMISDELRSGNIDADPCCHSEEDSQCRFCDWVSACQFRDGRDRDRLRYILPVKPEEFWKELEEGGGDPWQS